MSTASQSNTVPTPDIVGPHSAGAANDSNVLAIARVCDELLAPNAERSDRESVPREYIDALADAGAMAVQFPAELGGLGGTPDMLREVFERIAGACGSTWFCWAQHRTACQILIESSNAALRDRWLSDFVAGSRLGAVAFAHLRRPKQTVFATAASDGTWLFDGKLDWVTSWPIADACAVQIAAVDGEGNLLDQVVSAFVDIPKPDSSQAPGLRAGPDLELAAMGGTHTWPVRFGGYRAVSADVASVVTQEDWNEGNSRLAWDVNPAVLGMARAAINELAFVADRTGQQNVADTAQMLRDELLELRADAYALQDRSWADAAFAESSQNERLALRAGSLDLNMRASVALVAASGGGAMSLFASPQRRARESIFMLVQGQTGQLRTATLRSTVRR